MLIIVAGKPTPLALSTRRALVEYKRRAMLLTTEGLGKRGREATRAFSRSERGARHSPRDRRVEPAGSPPW